MHAVLQPKHRKELSTPGSLVGDEILTMLLV